MLNTKALKSSGNVPTDDTKAKIERLHAKLVQHPHSLCPDAVWHVHADALRDIALRLFEDLTEGAALVREGMDRVIRLEQENKRLAAEVERLQEDEGFECVIHGKTWGGPDCPRC